MPSGQLKKCESISEELKVSDNGSQGGPKRSADCPVEQLVKSMLDEGGIKMENMIEIEWVFKQITQDPKVPKENVEKMVGAMELLINMSNCYLNNFEKLKRFKD
tara:strand:+ start:80 stop:391 length:312 start_codon:yes stop_codon:yes gene_type:complete